MVVARDHAGLKELSAHIATSSGELDAEEVRRLLRSELPEYMVPSTIVLSDRLPVTPTGKVDRTALAGLDVPPPARERTYAAPVSDVERALVTVWQTVLQRDHVGTEDNFFELGGHSLLMVRAQRMLQDSVGVPLSLVELFQYPTVKALAAHISAPAAAESGDTRAEQRAARQREGLRQRTARGAARRQERV